jgi:hypothetical protein
VAVVIVLRGTLPRLFGAANESWIVSTAVEY